MKTVSATDISIIVVSFLLALYGIRDIDKKPKGVYSYLNKLENAYILHRCSRFDVQDKEILKTQEKFYLADPALRYSVLGYSAYRRICRRQL